MTDFIPPHGGYRDLKSYQMAEIVHDARVVFCDRFSAVSPPHCYGNGTAFELCSMSTDFIGHTKECWF